MTDAEVDRCVEIMKERFRLQHPPGYFDYLKREHHEVVEELLEVLAAEYERLITGATLN